MKISLVKLGKEECEVCVSALQHRKTSSHPETISTDPCSTCTRYDKHLRIAKISRDAYRSDGEAVIEDTLVLAVDLQKVTLNKYIIHCIK